MIAIFLIATNLILVIGPVLLWYVSRLMGRLLKKKVYFKKFGLASLAFCLIWNLLFLYGYAFGRFSSEINEEEYCDERVPEAFDGYRIVHISDLHISGFDGHEAFLDTLISQINNLHPDLICFTGDLVSFSHEELVPYQATLRKLKARDGVVSILGNHDYGIYDRSLKTIEEREADKQRLIVMQRDSLDWNLLLNENMFLRHGKDSICIAGVENQACGIHQKVRRGALSEALKGADGSFTILLSHDPTHWQYEVVHKTDIPLTLSGHTHAMQFKVLGWTPCRCFYKYSDGKYVVENQTLFVSSGLGQLLPFRIGAAPEIAVHTLKKTR